MSRGMHHAVCMNYEASVDILLALHSTAWIDRSIRSAAILSRQVESVVICLSVSEVSDRLGVSDQYQLTKKVARWNRVAIHLRQNCCCNVYDHAGRPSAVAR